MLRLAPKIQKKLVPFAIILLVAIIVLTKFSIAHNTDHWQDIANTASEPKSQLAPSTMNSDQINVSLKNILKQYNALISNSKQANKSEVISSLDKLYQMSLEDYVNAKELGNSSAKQTVTDLTQASAYLTASIFEMKDSMNCTGDISQIQIKNSKEDLSSAMLKIEEIK